MENENGPPSSGKNSDGLLEANSAVLIKNANKYYGTRTRTHVLQDLNMSVPRGVIYGLLGPSGCGKTTLIRVIVGREKLNSGELKLFGMNPGAKSLEIPGRQVGYMPQEIALHNELTIMETMFYYGRLNKMDFLSIQSRAELLIKVLELPHSGRCIRDLSGGQKRRVSLFVSLLHEPELILLDEPTVGVDPILRQQIWDHLLEIVNDTSKKRTIIITTHYVEEARQAHLVGMMRYGRILDEDAPFELMEKFNAFNLEEVFYQLCVNIDDSAPENQEPSFTISTNVVPRSARSNCFKCDFSFLRWKALTRKNFILMFRKTVFLIFQLIFPIIQASTFCIAIGGDIKGISIAVVNEDVPIGSCRPHLECIIQDASLNVSNSYLNISSGISCRQLRYMESDAVETIFYPSFEMARARVMRGEHWGIIHFVKGYSENVGSLMKQIVLKKSDKTLDIDTGMHIYLDTTNQQIAFAILSYLESSFRLFLKNELRYCNRSSEYAEPDLNYQNTIHGTKDTSYTEFMAPGIIISIVFIMAVGLTSQSLVKERRGGLLERSLVSGVKTSEIILAILTTQLLIMFLQVLLVILFMFVFFKIPSRGSMILVIVLVSLQGFCGMSYGLLISAVCSSDHAAIQLAVGSFFPLLLISGIIWPLEGMPTYLKTLSLVMPQTLACKALRGILSQGWNLNISIVYLGFLATIIWIIIFQIGTLMVFRFHR